MVFDNIEEIRKYFGFKKSGKILESDIHSHSDYTDDNDRKYHDAEVLTTLAANSNGNIIEIGTSSGRGTYKLATNTSGMVYTVNALPEQITGEAVTHALTKNQIGSYLVEKRIANFQQIYANSLTWEVTENIKNVSMTFIDGCHDEQYVCSDSKKVFNHIHKNGFIVWHDFNPTLRFSSRHAWINSSMTGVERFCRETGINTQIYHLKDSWMGFYQI